MCFARFSTEASFHWEVDSRRSDGSFAAGASHGTAQGEVLIDVASGYLGSVRMVYQAEATVTAGSANGDSETTHMSVSQSVEAVTVATPNSDPICTRARRLLSSAESEGPRG